MHAFAKDCKNLDKLPKYVPNLSKVTDASQMFEDAHAFDQPLNHWDVAHIEDMSAMFKNAFNFNQPLDNWNVSSVQNMNMMFMHASSFSYYPENWIVPKGQAEAMFHYTKVENSPMRNRSRHEIREGSAHD